MPDDRRPRLVTVRSANHRLARADDGTTSTCYLGSEEWAIACARIVAVLEEDLALVVRFCGHGRDRAEPETAGPDLARSDWFCLIVEAFEEDLPTLEQALRALVQAHRLGPVWTLVGDEDHSPVVAELPSPT